MLSKTKLLYPSGILFVGLLLLAACNGQTSIHDSDKTRTVSAYDSTLGKSYTYTKYELPLSVDVFKSLKSKNQAFNMQLMHKLQEQGKYFTDTKRAFALGIYSADLAYAAIYEQSQDVVNYFGAAIELAHKLNIQDGYNSGTLERAYDNINNEDSLTGIAGESYWLTCSSLEKNKQENILPLMVVGSWIESMHILTRKCIEGPTESGLYQELYVQLKHLDKLISYINDVLQPMEASESKNEIEKILARLNTIQEKYLLIEISAQEKSDPAQFKEVILQMEDLRNWMLE